MNWREEKESITEWIARRRVGEGDVRIILGGERMNI